METIRVSKDKWNFEEAGTGKRFIPFGSNFAFHYYTDETKEKTAWSICIMTETPFRTDVIERAFAAAHNLNMNVMKIFLPITSVLPDPQQGSHAKIGDMTPSFFERLEFIFGLSEKYGIYLSLTLAEWGIQCLNWFQEGGQVFGASDKTAAVDSFAIIGDFWKQLAAWAKGRPQLFSYNFAVESYLPGGVCKNEKVGNQWYMYDERYGKKAYQDFLHTKYGTLEALNSVYGTAYTAFDEICPPEDIKWDPYLAKYNLPTQMVIDYTEMKEIICYYYYKNMADAVREVDREHMITLGLHPDQCGIGPKGWAYKVANINNKLLDFVDYVTAHLYTQMSYLIDRPPLPAGPNGTLEPHQSSPEELERRRHECELYARFIYADRPVMLEEFGHHRLDEEENPGEEVYTETLALLRQMVGHVSGFMLWNYGNFMSEDKRILTCVMDFNQEVTSWGKKWSELMLPDGEVARIPVKRTPAKTVVQLDYDQAYAPTVETPGEALLNNWNKSKLPVDFELEENRALVIYKAQKKKRVWY